jgi:hypothetical protein
MGGDDYAGFDTAWGPPIAWATTVSALYPHLSLELQYEECGCDFAGVVTLERGEEVTPVQTMYMRHCFIHTCAALECGAQMIQSWYRSRHPQHVCG